MTTDHRTRTPEAAADYEWATRPDIYDPREPATDRTPMPCPPEIAEAIREGLRFGRQLQDEHAARGREVLAVERARLAAARVAQDAAEDAMGAREWAKSRTVERWAAR